MRTLRGSNQSALWTLSKSYKRKLFFKEKKISHIEWKYKLHDPNLIYKEPRHLKNFNLVGDNWTSGKNHLPILLLWGFNDWKFGFVAKYLSNYRIAFADRKKMGPEILWQSMIFPEPIQNFIVWGKNETVWVRILSRIKGIEIWRMEDGFLRSMGLGANHTHTIFHRVG